MIADATLEFCSTQATASCAMVRPACSASGLSRCTVVSTSSVRNCLMKFAPDFSSVARDPAGGGCPGRYLPVSTPCAIGDHTIWLIPSSSQVGTTSASMTRHNMEYCGWLETNGIFSSWASACAARICSARHSETPT